ncbi:hypothetical protein CEQ90_14670 [Lewinellaceae bacterium SD302]|nr:hypothetical protein CEQ90_14670 [Lewinellaceae bacterium SD302]
MKIDKTRNIDQLYDELPEPERTTASILRELVFETIEVKKEKLSWGAPFYYGYSPICHIWPGSIPWGGLKEGVALGFWRGKEFADTAYFDHDGLKQLSRKVYLTPKDIDITVVQSLLLEGERLDRAHYLRKK